MSNVYCETEFFLFSLYSGDKLQLGVPPVSNSDLDYAAHNGVKEEKADTLVDALIPSYVNGKKVTQLCYRCLSKLNNLKSVFIPNTIKTINGDTFLGCFKLNKVIFEENSKVRRITQYTFYSTAITTITFPPSLVETIGDSMFYNCTQLHTIAIQSFFHINQTSAFSHAPENIRILVPKNYPKDNFGGKPVIRSLPDYPHKHHITCIHKQSHKLCFNLILINLLI